VAEVITKISGLVVETRVYCGCRQHQTVQLSPADQIRTEVGTATNRSKLCFSLCIGFGQLLSWNNL